MSKEKAARIQGLSPVDRAVYTAKRNQRCYWQRLSHDDWVEFCEKMGQWFCESAPDEWDTYVAANKARKAESDKRALEMKMMQRQAGGKHGHV